MIPFDFEYYKPSSLFEATQLYKHLDRSGKDILYYGGGTEIISMARAGSIKFSAVIDLKAIPECNVLKLENSNLIIGSMVTLSQITELGLFPLLGETVSRIADHTIQCKITLGGNLASTIAYREASLPLLLTQAKVRICGINGIIDVPFINAFNGRLQIEKGSFITQVLIGNDWLDLPYVHVKRTKNDKIDYPLLTLTAIKKDNKIFASVSGVSNFPFIIPDYLLNGQGIAVEQKVSNTISGIKNLIINDISGSSNYREFVLRNVLIQMFEILNGGI